MMKVISWAGPETILVEIDGDKFLVPDNGGNMHRQEIAAWEAEGNVIPPFVPPPPFFVIPKDLPWRRMTDAEALSVKNAMSMQLPRFQMIYDGAPAISSGDELYSTLTTFLTAVLNAKRAAELLAPGV